MLGGASQSGDEPVRLAARVIVFDACNVGVVLRAVLFTEAVVGVGAMFMATGFVDWLLRFSLLTGGVLPATLSWLIVACVLKGTLARLATPAQWVAGIVMGALAGLYGCGLLAVMGLLTPAPWAASAAAGALLSSVLVAGLVWRAKARMPAATAARLAELQSRIRPHFLFNSLNAVLSLVRTDPRRAETALEDMADLFRTFMADNRDLVPLEREVELCRQYLDIEQLRLGDRLRVEWH
ncbi:MAG: histidine kinase, partial [Polaromonas sp.]|nr:histidine kinase [Polaromonas sp.]